ncbi:cytochrome P450 [Catellatospora methionotrophica]|uniref:cytochrome P450 n=1 Tax=Catellatospora methionotrophica TaxID=121620 RepID=UPI0033E9A6CF
MSAAVLDVDLTEPATFLRPDLREVWRRLRQGPAYRHPATVHGGPFWVLTRHADVLAVYQNTEVFSSARGNMLASLLPGDDPAGGKLLAVSDPPRHTAVRTMMLRSFSPRVLQPIVAKVRERAESLVRAVVDAGEVDFAAAVAEQLPISTICDLLGVPESDHGLLLRLSKQALSSDEADQSARSTALARNEILLYFAELADRRRADPRDDVTTALATTPVDGQLLSDEEVVLNCYGLILAGDETSRLAMTAAVLDFIRHPGQWRALRDGRVSPTSAVEEILRWNSPAMHVGRTALADVDIAGQTIRAGDVVTAWNSAANLDEAVFDRPDVFDLARTPNRHLAFGYGPHFCLGAYLGRAEVTAVIEALCRTAHDFELRGEPQPLYSTFLRGHISLPVAVTPARRAVTQIGAREWK